MMDLAQRIIEDLETLSVTIEYYSKGRARYGYQDAVGEVIRFVKNDVRDKTANLDVATVVGKHVESKMEFLQEMESLQSNDAAIRAYQDIMVVLGHHQAIVERVLYVKQ